MNATVFLVSAAVLAYQIVLMRMFSIAQWHHFASMIISIALLGFGLSGTVLSLWREQLRRGLGWCVVGFVLSVPICTWLAQQIPFTALLIVWQPRQVLGLLVIDLVLLIPFTFGALVIGLALARAREERTVGRVYAINLFGSGIGAIAGLALCFLPLPVKISEYKGLSMALAMAGARTVWTAYHPLGRVDVVESPALRVEPGLSLAYTGPMPTQQVVFVDADGGSALDKGPIDYTDWLPSAASYAVRVAQKVLVIGVGGGTELRQALRHNAADVVGVEMHPDVARLAAEGAPAANVRVSEGRAFIRHSREHYDVVQISLLDSIGTSATGIGAANESYLYTVEALEEFIEHLTPDGVLCITRWLKTPPRDELRLFATTVDALERLQVTEPAGQLIFVRGWATGTLLVKRSPFTNDEIAHVRRWADERLFDVDYFPGVAAVDVNRHNVMNEPTYFLAAQQLLFGDREQFFREYLFNVRPVTDDRPYFFHFFRWKTAPHLLRTMGREWLPFVEWGYVVLVATLLQATIASVILIGLPLWFGRQRGEGIRAVFIYFACLGLGFMFLEIMMLQKFTLFLGNPLYAATVVVATFLVFAGLGASQVGRRVRGATWPAVSIVALLAAESVGLPVLFRLLLASSDVVRVMASILVLAPLAFCMGMMFPLGLDKTPAPLVPWAWGVNGCLSVIGVVLASVLAMDFGFTAVLVTAAALYACAGATFSCLRG